MATTNMAVTRVTVNTTATQIVASRAGRSKLILTRVGGPNTVKIDTAIGNANTVTLANGFMIYISGTQSVELETESAVWGIVAATPAAYQAMEIY